MNKKILFIQPTIYDDKGILVKKRKLYFVGLAHPLLSALLPEGWSSEICIEAIEDIPWDTDCDVIGIGAVGHAANRAKDIAVEFCRWLNDLNGTSEEKTSEEIIPHARLLILPEKDAKGTQEFIGLAYLAEVWQNSEWKEETKEEHAKKFIFAGTKLRLTDGEYTVVERKK